MQEARLDPAVTATIKNQIFGRSGQATLQEATDKGCLNSRQIQEISQSIQEMLKAKRQGWPAMIRHAYYLSLTAVITLIVGTIFAYLGCLLVRKRMDLKFLGDVFAVLVPSTGMLHYFHMSQSDKTFKAAQQAWNDQHGNEKEQAQYEFAKLIANLMYLRVMANKCENLLEDDLQPQEIEKVKKYQSRITFAIQELEERDKIFKQMPSEVSRILLCKE